MSQPKVIFKESDHSYWIEGNKGISVTKVIDNFKDPMDSSYWQTYKAFELAMGKDKFKEVKKAKGYRFPFTMKPPLSFFDYLTSYVKDNDFFEAKQKIKQSWSDSMTNGTLFHEERENEMYDDGEAINPFTGKTVEVIKNNKEFDNESLKDNLFDLKDGCYPELLVWWEFDNYCVMGQIDVCFIETDEKTGERFVDVNDWKTNAKLGTRESYFKYHSPFSHLSDSKLVKYNLQQSMYIHILDKWGFTPRHLAITHFSKYDVSTAKIIQMDYMKNEVSQMLDILNKLNG